MQNLNSPRFQGAFIFEKAHLDEETRQKLLAMKCQTINGNFALGAPDHFVKVNNFPQPDDLTIIVEDKTPALVQKAEQALISKTQSLNLAPRYISDNDPKMNLLKYEAAAHLLCFGEEMLYRLQQIAEKTTQPVVRPAIATVNENEIVLRVNSEAEQAVVYQALEKLSKQWPSREVESVKAPATNQIIYRHIGSKQQINVEVGA